MSLPKLTEESASSIISLERVSNLKEQAYQQIKTLLLTGKLPHGTVASVPLIAKRLGISRTPVREAFLDLEKEGLIRILPKKGAVTNLISPEKKREIFLIREALEGMVVTKLSESITKTQVAALRSIFERHKKTPRGEAGWDEFIRIDREFHLTMASFAGFEKIKDILVNIRDLMEMIGREALSSHGRRETIFREHERILAALERKNKRAARKAIQYHLKETERSLKS
jgi:DNA-binding GntR family transcriptional regulator